MRDSQVKSTQRRQKQRNKRNLEQKNRNWIDQAGKKGIFNAIKVNIPVSRLKALISK